MGMCKGCGEVFGAIEMKDGYCKDCWPKFVKENTEKPRNNSQYYDAILGERNRIYYKNKFDKFDETESGLNASWNWPAFFFSALWSLYRKMYGWFFVFWGITMVSNMLDNSGSPELSAIVLIVPTILFAIFANSLYHKKITKIIEKAKNEISDENKLVEYLKYKGGVNIWAPLILVIIPIVGILLAVIIPKLAN